eukprot:403353573
MNDDYSDKDHTYIDEDERKSMAIVNLQAMLNLEDVDKIIGLLEQNNWDEAQAAIAFYAQEMHSQERQGRASQNNRQSMYDDQMMDDGDDRNNVRAPMQFQQEQLIDDNTGLLGNIGFYQAIAAQRQSQQRRPTNYRFTNNLDERDEEMKVDGNEDQQNQNNGGIISNVINFVKYIGWGIWSGFTYFYRIIFPRGDVNPNTNGEEFTLTFRQAMRDIGMQEQVKIRFFERSFLELCEMAREQKKPMLVFMLNEQDEETFRFTANALQNDQVQHILNNQFLNYGMFRDRVDVNLQRVLNFPQLTTLCVWMLTVGHDQNITIQSRHHGMADEFMPEHFLNFINQNLSLYRVIAEEDPEYQRIQILQDAGIIPVQNRSGRQSSFYDDHQMIEDPLIAEEQNRIQQDRQLKERQKRELEEAQMLDQIKMLEQQEKKRQQDLEEQQRLEQLKREEEIKRQKLIEAQQKKDQLPEEPAQDDPEACHLVLRLPGSGERVNRRFLKSQKIQVLYDFVESLGEQLQFESHHGQFTIFQSMPRKEYTNLEKTLGEEGLFPRAMLQIKENE